MGRPSTGFDIFVHKSPSTPCVGVYVCGSKCLLVKLSRKVPSLAQIFIESLASVRFRARLLVHSRPSSTAARTGDFLPARLCRQFAYK